MNINKPEKQNIFTLSYGKDSIAQIILAQKLKIKIDLILTVDMKFDDQTSAMLPEEDAFITKIDKFILDYTGIPVTHLQGKTFVNHFFRRFGDKSKHKGEIIGWPFLFHHSCALIKRDTIRAFLKPIKNNYILFLGICADETKRYNSLLSNQRSILYEFKLTQANTFSICKHFGLLFPSYNRFNKRSGCFFCPFQPIDKLKYLISNYPDLYNKMYELGLNCSRPFHVWEKKHLLPIDEMKKKLKI